MRRCRSPPELNRPLSASEMSLARWLLEHGEPKAWEFLEQLAAAQVTPWRCPCGCGSISFHIKGREPACHSRKLEVRDSVARLGKPRHSVIPDRVVTRRIPNHAVPRPCVDRVPGHVVLLAAVTAGRDRRIATPVAGSGRKVGECLFSVEPLRVI